MYEIRTCMKKEPFVMALIEQFRYYGKYFIMYLNEAQLQKKCASEM